MKRDKKFIIDSIKMDLFRVVTAAGDTSKKPHIETIKTFLEHAHKDFEKTELTEEENEVKMKLHALAKSMDDLEDPHKRLRWAEDVLTARSML